MRCSYPRGKSSLIASILCVLAPAALVAAAPTTVRVDDLIAQKTGLGKASAAMISETVERAAQNLRAGDALILPFNSDLGTVVLANLPENIQIIGGKNGTIKLSGLVKNVYFFGTTNVGIDTRGGLGKSAFPGATLANILNVHTTGEVNATSLNSTYWIDHVLGGGKEFKINGQMTNCTMVWMRYNSEGAGATANPSMSFRLNGTGQNVKVLHLIEHNQTNQKPAMIIDNAVGMQLANGSTESCGGAFLYMLNNCKNVHLAHRRFYHRQSRTGWGLYAPQKSLIISGGEGNIIDNLVDIGNPQDISLQCSDPSVKFFSSIFEEAATFTGENNGRWYFSFVTNSMPQKNTWTEPRVIDNEQVLTYDGPAGKVDLLKGSKLPTGVSVPVPPTMPKCDIPAPQPLQYKRAAGFGRDVLLAGADPTGRKPSDSAIRKVLAEKNLLELPAGTYLLSSPLEFGTIELSKNGVFEGKKAWILGAGQELTRIVYRGRGAVVRTVPALAKAAEAEKTEIMLADISIQGGDYGYEISGHNNFQKNVAYSGYTIAGVFFDKAIKGGEPEQSRFIGCTFNGGQYGFRYNGYSDKYLIFGCSFENHSKGGIYCTEIVHWHSGIYQCTFKNISGPGVAILGGSSTYGYGPWVFTIDNCTFDECGSETEAVVNMGFSWEAVLSHSRITTKSKSIYAGFKGNFAIIDNVVIDANLKSGIGMYLGHQRFEKTAGVGLSRLTNVTTSGKLEFMSHSEAMEGAFYKAGLYEGKPFAFAHLLYKVKSDNVNADYAIYNDGKLAYDITTNSIVKAGLPELQKMPAKAFVPSKAFDISGRMMSLENGKMPISTSKGVYLIQAAGHKLNRAVQVR